MNNGQCPLPVNAGFQWTTREAARSILEEGLKPMGRRLVHLSSTYEEAANVGRRRQRNPVVLEVDAKRAWKDGVEFRRSGAIYVVNRIPVEYIIPR